MGTNLFKTGVLLAGITALFLVIGFLLGGQQGMVIALVFALGTNLFAYWNSDKMVLRLYRAEPVDARTQPELLRMVQELAANAGIPEPRAYIMHNPQPNAFATGRNPENAAVAVTTGLMERLEPHEVRAVLAHELAHIKHRDTLIMTITATLAGAIGMLANFAFFFGGSRDGERANPLAGILIAILAPMAAMLVQMAISRTREYSADQGGADISGDPLALASALQKISSVNARVMNVDAERNPATAHLFIMSPLHGRGVDNLFATHPSAENRIAALRTLAAQMGNVASASPAPAASGPWGQQTDVNRPRGPWE